MECRDRSVLRQGRIGDGDDMDWPVRERRGHLRATGWHAGTVPTGRRSGARVRATTGQGVVLDGRHHLQAVWRKRSKLTTFNPIQQYQGEAACGD
jgi:hypothetical protein